MTRLANLVARTVSRSALGVDVEITLGTETVRLRGTWSRAESDEAFLSTDRIVAGSLLRVPACDLPGEPKVGDRVHVDGERMFVAAEKRRHAVWLLDLTKRRPG